MKKLILALFLAVSTIPQTANSIFFGPKKQPAEFEAIKRLTLLNTLSIIRLNQKIEQLSWYLTLVAGTGCTAAAGYYFKDELKEVFNRVQTAVCGTDESPKKSR